MLNGLRLRAKINISEGDYREGGALSLLGALPLFDKQCIIETSILHRYLGRLGLPDEPEHPQHPPFQQIWMNKFLPVPYWYDSRSSIDNLTFCCNIN